MRLGYRDKLAVEWRVTEVVGQAGNFKIFSFMEYEEF